MAIGVVAPVKTGDDLLAAISRADATLRNDTEHLVERDQSGNGPQDALPVRHRPRTDPQASNHRLVNTRLQARSAAPPGQGRPSPARGSLEAISCGFFCIRAADLGSK